MAVIGIDIGTGSAKAVLASTSGVVLATAQVKHVTSSPQPGWFEHDALSVWWDNVVRLCRDLLAAGPNRSRRYVSVASARRCYSPMHRTAPCDLPSSTESTPGPRPRLPR